MRTITKKLSLSLAFLWLCLLSVNANALQILTICDSITQGLQRTASGVIFGIKSPLNGAANIGGYQPILNQLLDANIEPSTVYNWGIGGERSFQTVNRINFVLNSRPADYILILCGANDVANGISSNSTRANIEFMVNQSLAKGVVPVVAELTPYTLGSFDFNIWASYNPKIRAVATQKKVPLVYMFGKGNSYNAASWVSDLRKCWRGGPLCGNAPPYHSGDNLHLSNFGYQKMALKWFNVLQELEHRLNLAPVLNILLLD